MEIFLPVQIDTNLKYPNLGSYSKNTPSFHANYHKAVKRPRDGVHLQPQGLASGSRLVRGYPQLEQVKSAWAS